MSFKTSKKKAAYREIHNEDSGELDHDAQPTGRRWRPWLVALYSSLGLACCSASFLAGRHMSHSESHLTSSSSSPIPFIPQSAVTFEPDTRYGGPSSSESDTAWSSLSPPGEGFVVVDNPSQFNLQPGKSTDQGELYDVAVFHQLHCLTKIREHAALLRFALETNNTAGFEKTVSPQGDHMAHCFDYLRQSIMCAGDLTLEWPKEGKNGERLVVDGWGIQHQCKSWDAISQYVANNSVE